MQTKVYPLYEVVEGRYSLTRKSKKFKSVKEYLKIQGRFRHLADEEIEKIQSQVDEKYADLVRKLSLRSKNSKKV